MGGPIEFFHKIDYSRQLKKHLKQGVSLCSYHHHHHHHHLLATFKLNYNINNYVRARRPPRNHQAYRGGHLGLQYVDKFVVEVRLGQFRLDSLKIQSFFFLKIEKLVEPVIDIGREFQILGP